MKKYIRPEAEYIEFYSDVEVTTYDDASVQKDVEFGIVEDSGSWDE